MADELDREPIPPNSGEQGFPPRYEPFQPGPVRYHLQPLAMTMPDGARVFALILDTTSARSVAYMTEGDLLAFAEAIQTTIGELPPKLVQADLDDLRRLHDAAPFEGPA